MQCAVLPELLPLDLTLRHPPSDFLISAPTGSGKTLAYAIPIVEILKTRHVPRLRCLIILPTRDLAVQVKETLDGVAVGTSLKIGLAVGQSSLKREQRNLIDELAPK